MTRLRNVGVFIRKRRHIKLGRLGITQKKAYNILFLLEISAHENEDITFIRKVGVRLPSEVDSRHRNDRNDQLGGTHKYVLRTK